MMSDNPFNEPDDSDRTIIRPVPGGAVRRAAPPPLPAPPRPRAIPVAEGAESLAIGATPLAAAAAPLLQLLARLRNTANPPDTGDLRERTARELRAFEQAARDGGVAMEQLRPAHFALCASLDDAVLNTPWGEASGWDKRSLTATSHPALTSPGAFFDQLGQMREDPTRFMPVVELVYLCLSLGFMGQYRAAPHGPAELGRIREETYAVIVRQRPGAAGAPALAPHWQGVAAPYRPSAGGVPLWVGGVAGLALVAGMFLWCSSTLNAASDGVYAAMLAAPPADMPQITRATLAVPPPPAPDPPDPGAADRLRAALHAEIAQGSVAVVGTPSTPVLRIPARRLFGPTNATLQPGGKKLLEQAGQALKDEAGTVQAIAYTDSQPVHTVAFPSNFALSAARAQAVRAVLASALGDAGRVAAEGRADADAIAPNANAEGREQNRRVDILLHRPEN